LLLVDAADMAASMENEFRFSWLKLDFDARLIVFNGENEGIWKNDERQIDMYAAMLR